MAKGAHPALLWLPLRVHNRAVEPEGAAVVAKHPNGPPSPRGRRSRGCSGPAWKHPCFAECLQRRENPSEFLLDTDEEPPCEFSQTASLAEVNQGTW